MTPFTFTNSQKLIHLLHSMNNRSTVSGIQYLYLHTILQPSRRFGAVEIDKYETPTGQITNIELYQVTLKLKKKKIWPQGSHLERKWNNLEAIVLLTHNTQTYKTRNMFSIYCRLKQPFLTYTSNQVCTDTRMMLCVAPKHSAIHLLGTSGGMQYWGIVQMEDHGACLQGITLFYTVVLS